MSYLTWLDCAAIETAHSVISSINFSVITILNSRDSAEILTTSQPDFLDGTRQQSKTKSEATPFHSKPKFIDSPGQQLGTGRRASRCHILEDPRHQHKF